MFDTIILRIHDLKKYGLLLKWLYLNSKMESKTETGIVNSDELDKLRKRGLTDEQIINYTKFYNTGKYLMRSASGKKINNSNHYELSFVPDYPNDYLQFNFSIPKYIYGTNIIMFTEHMSDVHFKYYDNGLFSYNLNRAPKFLKLFVSFFLRNEFALFKVDLKDVEVNRIDPCYNQVLNSKTDALFFIKQQMKHKKKHSREENTGRTDYETSFMYKTKNCTSKIYHKGAEYKANDRKHHERINKLKRYAFFNIDGLQELADRTVRYELTVRPGEINSLYKHNMFRRNCPYWKIDYKNYKRIGNTMKQNERISKNAGQMSDKDKAAYLNLNPYRNISKNDRDTFRSVSKIIETIPKFMIEIDSESEKYNSQNVNYTCDTALWSEELAFLCLKKLSNFVQEYQLNDLPDEDIIGLKIDKYNREHRVKLAKADLIQFYLLLLKYGSFKEAAFESRYSRATIYRYKDRLKKIGITENFVKPEGNSCIPVAPVDFKLYHRFFNEKCNVLKGIKLPNFQIYK